MLKSSITFRADALLHAFLVRLADETDRNQSDFLRDLIWLLSFNETVGSAVKASMKDPQASYINLCD